MRRFRLSLVVVSAAALLGAAAPSLAATSGHAVPASGTTKKVRASNYYFCSWSKSSCSASDAGHVTKVLVGTKVKWIYEDTTGCDTQPLCPGHDVKVGTHKKSHTVKSDGALIYAMTFNSVGKFHYVCTHHKSLGMTGTVKVHT